MSAAPSHEPHTDLSTIAAAVDHLRRTFDSGRTRPEAWRREQLKAIGALAKDNARRFVEALAADFGKPTFEAFGADVSSVINEASSAQRSLKKWMKPRKVATSLPVMPARSRVLPEPLGVVLIISPWNYPVQLLLSPLIGAVAAGNCAVLKPSELTPYTSELLAELCARYLDTDAIHLIEGGVEETTEVLAQRFDHIMYTGNGNVAKIVMEAAAKHLTPVTLELGGKSPCIVDEKANLDVAAGRIAWGKFMNAGQTCIAPDYVLVHEKVEKPLLEKLGQKLDAFYGADPKTSPDLARIVNIRHTRRLAGLLKDAGTVFRGGDVDEDARYVAPTILTDVDPNADIMQEEIFGPILPVLRVPDMNAAVSFVNAKDKPLALYVFSEDDAVCEDVISRTSSGGACANATIFHIANPNLPFGGVGPSGMGAYHGQSSFDTFSHLKSVLYKSTRFDVKLMFPPYKGLKKKMIDRML